MPANHLQFIPTRIEGLSDVTSVTVFPDRIELTTPRGIVTHRFVDIARWPKPAALRKFLYRLGIKPRWLPVADRDWFHAPADMFFVFYTNPPLKVFMPRNESKADRASSYFARIQAILRHGGFDTSDFG